MLQAIMLELHASERLAVDEERERERDRERERQTDRDKERERERERERQRGREPTAYLKAALSLRRDWRSTKRPKFTSHKNGSFRV